jgi:NAD(P)-dependent dehydrogenase (short-subunit alcohol dehydrogenase family)
MSEASRVALITGGATGMGRAMSEALLADGARVAVMGRRADVLEAFARESNEAAGEPRVLPVIGDVSQVADCEQAVARVVERFGALHVLVNNAGLGVSSLRPDAEVNLPGLAELSPEVWQRFFAVNVHGPFYMTRSALPHLRAAGSGRVINHTTSFFTMHRVLPYGASKAALESSSAIWAKELEGDGITVNVILPGGPTNTDFIDDGAGIERARMLSPAVMAPLVRWLASPDSDGVTGRRFIGGLWDPSLPPAEAAEKAGDEIGWPQLAGNVIWPD